QNPRLCEQEVGRDGRLAPPYAIQHRSPGEDDVLLLSFWRTPLVRRLQHDAHQTVRIRLPSEVELSVHSVIAKEGNHTREGHQTRAPTVQHAQSSNSDHDKSQAEVAAPPLPQRR